MRKLKDHRVPQRPNQMMEEVEGEEVTSVYEAYTMYYNVKRNARRPKSDLPWTDPYSRRKKDMEG
jgi:hypothetical protein